MSFANLKKNRAASTEALKNSLANLNTLNKYGKDTSKYWEPTVDKAGNGSAVIRFLPAPEGEDEPFVRYWDHGFQGPTGLWYIENSLTSIGQDDPVSELNSKLWATGLDSDKDIARERKRRLHFVSNIQVISDPAKPECDGGVYLYKYGKKIFDKINDLMHPQFEDEQAVNPFDFWDGATFKLRIRKEAGYRNYDKSTFDAPSPLSKDDKVLEEIYGKLHSLKAEIDPSNFKSYDELRAKLYKVLGQDGATPRPPLREAEAPTQRERQAPRLPTVASGAADDDDDDGFSYFNNLAEEDDVPF